MPIEPSERVKNAYDSVVPDSDTMDALLRNSGVPETSLAQQADEIRAQILETLIALDQTTEEDIEKRNQIFGSLPTDNLVSRYAHRAHDIMWGDKTTADAEATPAYT